MQAPLCLAFAKNCAQAVGVRVQYPIPRRFLGCPIAGQDQVEQNKSYPLGGLRDFQHLPKSSFWWGYQHRSFFAAPLALIPDNRFGFALNWDDRQHLAKLLLEGPQPLEMEVVRTAEDGTRSVETHSVLPERGW